MRASQVSVRGQKKWVVSVMVSGKRQRVYRDTKEAALAAAQEVASEVQQFGSEASDLSLQERALVMRWRGKLDVRQIDSILAESHRAVGNTITVEGAVEQYRAAKQQQGTRHRADLKSRLDVFARTFSGRMLASVRPGEIDTFLTKRGSSGPNYFRILRALFNHAALHDWRNDNPMLKLKLPEVATREKEVFSVETMQRMLRLAAGAEPDKLERKVPLLWMLVLGALCGLRYSEAARAEWQHLDMVTGELYVPKMKTQKRGVRERWVSLPGVALSWFRHLGVGSQGRIITINDRNLRIQRQAMLDAANIDRWIENGCRRSFGSHHLAAYEDPGLTATLMGHTSAETTVGKYRVVRRKKVGEAWFAELAAERVLA